MKKPGKSPKEGSPQKGLPPGRAPPVGAGEATKPTVPPRPHGLLFLLAILKKPRETDPSEDKR